MIFLGEKPTNTYIHMRWVNEYIYVWRTNYNVYVAYIRWHHSNNNNNNNSKPNHHRHQSTMISALLWEHPSATYITYNSVLCYSLCWANTTPVFHAISVYYYIYSPLERVVCVVAFLIIIICPDTVCSVVLCVWINCVCVFCTPAMWRKKLNIVDAICVQTKSSRSQFERTQRDEWPLFDGWWFLMCCCCRGSSDRVDKTCKITHTHTHNHLKS